ncbi:MAG: putative metal-binding motif-containing protein, partial [Myxococcota bacterium]|nr:putative metal-binding motif-containing protein [Myxococcota bacterium]
MTTPYRTWISAPILVALASLALVAQGCSATEEGSLALGDAPVAPIGGDEDAGGSATVGTGSGGGSVDAGGGTQVWGTEDPVDEEDAGSGGGGSGGGDPGGEGGDLGAPCSDGDDCISGWCVPGPDGPVCSVPCTDSCPNGWDCKELQAAGGDPIYICVDPTARLCHPCLQDADCNQGVGGAHRCVDFGDVGSFCGVKCSGEGASCVEGTTCSPAGDDTSWQCIPTDGAECACNGLAQALALKTQCAVSNDAGVCEGWRTCGPDGLSDCAAPTPAVESCNGIDDDCNGSTDDAITDEGEACEVEGEWGNCPGTTVCEGGGLVCKGTPAAAESCNGLDDDCDGAIDESYLDHDADGVADCLDDDDDDDGVPDGEDCAPFAASVYPGAPEHCNGLDDDCDDTVDEPGAIGCTNRYRDIDGDQYGDLDASMICMCLADPASYYTATLPGDCDDLNPAINPGQQEICDGIDNNCDGALQPTEVDDDGDGQSECEGDCDDNDINNFPGNPEVCDGQDNDCDFAAMTTEVDLDADGSMICDGDCDDADP